MRSVILVLSLVFSGLAQAGDHCAVSLDKSVHSQDVALVTRLLAKKNYTLSNSAHKVFSVVEKCALDKDDVSACEVSAKIFCLKDNEFEQNQYRMIKTSAEINFEKTSRRLLRQAIQGFKACVDHAE